MTKRGTVPPSPGEECCCCGSADVLLHVYEAGVASVEEHQHCDVCYRTLIGSACVYPRSDDKVLRSLGACTNMILAAIRASRPLSPEP